MNTPTRDRPTAMAFDGDTIVYWRGDSDWRACRFGAATPLEITPELRELAMPQ